MVDGSSTLDGQANTPGETSQTGDASGVNVVLFDPVTTGATGTTTGSGVPNENAPTTTASPQNPLMADPFVTTGTAGMTVNCNMTLPCRWVSADTGFSVTITSTDNIGAQGRLSIEYSILTAHDTQVLIASTDQAVDSAGSRYEPSALRLGEGIGGRAQGVLAGSEINAGIEFDRPSTADALSTWRISLSDSGLVRQPTFTNIPIGSATTQLADCANTLPCAWESPQGDVTITLLNVSGSGSTNLLTTSFKVETTRSATVAIDSGATAVGIDGMSYKGRTHSIGLETGAQKITANTIPGAHVAGTVFFFRTQAMSPSLQNLTLTVYEDRPVPRWNPSFLSVPVQ